MSSSTRVNRFRYGLNILSKRALIEISYLLMQVSGIGRTSVKILYISRNTLVDDEY
jgi:hypothetical protein